jgi:hypothetical protein
MVDILQDTLSIFAKLQALTRMSPYHLPNTHLHSLPVHLLSSAFLPIVELVDASHTHVYIYIYACYVHNLNNENSDGDGY